MFTGSSPAHLAPHADDSSRQFRLEESIVGQSQGIQSCLERARLAAGTDSTVLITGETGTGKELFARAVHNQSTRSNKSFIVVDCAALPPTLVESVLFGHRKGSFTGADKAHEGLIAEAHGGTLFLDEVGELPLAAQKSFLRILQERRYRPVGGSTELESDFRLLAATNRNLEALCAEGQFRDDLMYRLRALSIELPPLRQRLEDLGDLACYQLQRLTARYKLPPKDLPSDVLDYLSAYDWPGNVRELFNTLEGSVTVARFEPRLRPHHLPEHIRLHAARASQQRSQSQAPEIAPSKAYPTLKEVRRAAAAQAEVRYLRDLLDHCEGDIKEACQLSGVSRSRLYDLLKEHGVR